MDTHQETRLIVWTIGIVGALIVLLAFLAHQGRPEPHHPPAGAAGGHAAVMPEAMVTVETEGWPEVFITGTCHYAQMGPAGFDAALSDGLQGQSLMMNGFTPPPNYVHALNCLATVLGTEPTMENLLTMLEERVRALGHLPPAGH